MSSKTALVLLAVVIVLAGGYYYFGTGSYNAGEMTDVNSMPTSDTTSGMRAEENVVIVMEQRPGTTVTGTVYLAAAGYLVIHADNNGKAGAILGSSVLLQQGETRDVKVTLSRAMQDGETLHAMLHFEKGGNATFNASEDTPVPSALGGPISGWFEVSANAPVDVEVVL